MRKKTKKLRAVQQIFHEIKSFGRFKNRNGDPIYLNVLNDLEEQKVVLQSRRENSIFWYPSEKFGEALEVGPANFWETRRKRSVNLFFEDLLNSDRGIFLSGMLAGFLLGGAITYLFLYKLLL